MFYIYNKAMYEVRLSEKTATGIRRLAKNEQETFWVLVHALEDCKWSFQGDSSATLTGQRMPCSWASPSAGPQAG